MAPAPSGEMWRQRLAQHQPGARQTRLESRPAQSHGRGGLVDGQALDVPQDHRQPVLRRKSHQLLLDPGAYFCAGVQLLRVLGPGLQITRSERLFLVGPDRGRRVEADRKSTRLNSSHSQISYAVFCLKKKSKWRVLTPGRAFRSDGGARLLIEAWRGA